MAKITFLLLIFALFSCAKDPDKGNTQYEDSEQNPLQLATTVTGTYNLTEVIVFTPFHGKVTYTASVGHKMTVEISNGYYVTTSEGDATLTSSADSSTLTISCGQNKIKETFLLNQNSEVDRTAITDEQATADTTYPFACSFVKSGEDNKPFYPPGKFTFSTSDNTDTGTRLIERAASLTSAQSINSAGQVVYLFNIWLKYSQ